MKIRVTATITVPVTLELDVEDADFENKGTFFALSDAVETFANAHLVSDQWECSHRVHQVQDVQIDDWTSI